MTVSTLMGYLWLRYEDLPHTSFQNYQKNFKKPSRGCGEVGKENDA